ncbi:MAG TPA: suppressor of fused domain protein [Mycobacteriales bacterium]|nr:suppressor of fused domain protein [Mycobacteriales bacterium]
MFGRRGKQRDEPPPGDEAPGWDAIDAALRPLYGDTEPAHVGYGLAPPLGEDLQGCSAYDAGGHWHFVTYGLSALYVKEEGEDPDLSGWGIELTFRLARGDETAPPTWAYLLLNKLARYVNSSGRVFAPGHSLDGGGAITGHPADEGAPPTALTGLAFAVDPRLGRIGTPHGEVTFVQVVGVTADERRRLAAGEPVLDELRARDPLLVTDLARA